MREILFRGKIIEPCEYQGQWLEGFYAVENGKPFIAIPKENGLNGFYCDPETVGQYTGLTDKNGARIFDGDIVSGHLDDLFPEDESRYEIAWIDYGWHLTNLDGTVDTAEQDWVNQNFEVIGNIYDNPELVEVEK